MAIWAGEIRSAARMLRRSPGFSATSIGAIALGIGACTAIFSVANKVLLEPLPYPEPDRLVQLMTTSPLGNQAVVSIPKFLAWRDTAEVFDCIAAYDIAGPSVTLTQGERPEPLRTLRVSRDYFRLFGARVEEGRTFQPEEDAAGGQRVLVISHQLWKTRFHGDPWLLGHTISVEQRDYRVVGVLADGFHSDPPADVWLPLRAEESASDHMSRVRVAARMRPGITLTTAQAKVDSTRTYFQLRHREAPMLFQESFTAVSLRDAVVGDVRPALFLLAGAVALVLLISCGNVAHLLLARSTRRARGRSPFAPRWERSDRGSCGNC